jgi:hypothetical protein
MCFLSAIPQKTTQGLGHSEGAVFHVFCSHSFQNYRGHWTKNLIPYSVHEKPYSVTKMAWNRENDVPNRECAGVLDTHTTSEYFVILVKKYITQGS